MFTNTRALPPSHKNYLTLPKTNFANTLNNTQTINANTYIITLIYPHFYFGFYKLVIE